MLGIGKNRNGRVVVTSFLSISFRKIRKVQMEQSAPFFVSLKYWNTLDWTRNFVKIWQETLSKLGLCVVVKRRWNARATWTHVGLAWMHVQHASTCAFAGTQFCKKKPDFYSRYLRQLRFRLNLLCFLTGGHFEVTKEKRPLDIKKVFTRWSAKLSLYYEFFSQTRKWKQLIREAMNFRHPRRDCSSRSDQVDHQT